MNTFRELFDLCCPHCEQMLVIVSNPTIEETKAEAARGDPRALAEMEYVERIEAFQARWDRERLHSAGQLPEIEGDHLDFVWDFQQTGGVETARTIIRLGDRVVWNEPALWEAADRFIAVEALLKERYGGRFADLNPTKDSELFLYGDDLRAASKIRHRDADTHGGLR
jgi:hypothetical protein